MKQIIIISFFCLITTQIYSQKDNNQPKKTAIKSAIIPGLGQIANKKYYKPPIIYTGIGISIYFLNKNQTLFKSYKNTYLNRTNNIEFVDEYPQYTDSQLLILSDYYNRNRDISLITTCAIYLLNIIDAYIDSHLLNFDISENIELTENNITIYFNF